MRIGPFGIWEIMIILVVVLVIFGPRRLPELAKGLGQSVRLFRKEMRDFKADLDLDEPSTRRAPRAADATASAPAAETATPAPPALPHDRSTS
jgi:sec-independent protein translocase protein TatA